MADWLIGQANVSARAYRIVVATYRWQAAGGRRQAAGGRRQGIYLPPLVEGNRQR
ncbi:hypothetical protein IBT47_01290 [Erwinia sp. S43]|uniref:hypothetical protein n=1 Tax=Erwinia sp. S43 TaxID=2769339 RepID=UPI001909ACF4|nr:hypothetical protein [Erwinia sp. S43]MBK0030906.1 hypothetical protein [Erwinia sp. S43]